MPAYNEGEHVYENLQKVCSELQGYNFEIVIVDDGSTDNTASEIQRIIDDKTPVQLVRQSVNMGKGAALVSGFKHSKGDPVVFLDADLEITPDYVLKFCHELERSGADVVVGKKDSKTNRFPFARRIMSYIYRRLVAVLFELSIYETQTGIKLFKREVLVACIPRLVAQRFAYDVELMVAASRFGFRMVELPVKLAYIRVGRFGRVSVRQVIGMFSDTMRIYYRSSLWYWLQPSWYTRAWMVSCVIGAVLFGIGLGKLLSPLVWTPPLQDILYYIQLQFLPNLIRDWFVLLFGLVLCVLSVIKLNISILSAFTRRDRGDLAGILKRKNI